MAPRPETPGPLLDGPFTTRTALTAGITRRQLQCRAWRRIWPHVYVAASIPDTPDLVLRAALLTFPPEARAVFAGPTAGWLHGLDTPPASPVHVNVVPDMWVSTRYNIRFRRNRLNAEDITGIREMPATGIERTLLDLANLLTLIEAVVHVDTALRLRLTTLNKLNIDLDRRAGAKGVRRYRRAVALADEKAGSPMESRFRLALVSNGLPAPETQVKLRDAAGAFVGRVDFYYPQRRLAIEYDGGQHRDQLTHDNRRQNAILNAGYRLLRFSAPDLTNVRRVVDTVRSALAA